MEYDRKINKIKSEIESIFGRRVQSRPDCEQISRDVLEKTGRSISYNTIRRLFNLSTSSYSSKISDTTLNILANYCGYPSLHELLLGRGKTDVSVEHIYKELQFFIDNNKICLIRFEQTINNYSKSNNLYFYLVQTVQIALNLDDVQFLSKLFEQDYLFTKNNYLSTHLYFMILELGAQLRNKSYKNELWRIWSGQKYGRSFYFELFVDMDDLIKSHYNGLEYYKNKNSSNEESLFANSLLYFRSAMLSQSKNSDLLWKELSKIKITTEIHPIPVARFFTAKLIHEKMNGVDSSKTLKRIINYEKDLKNNSVEWKSTIFFTVWILEGLVVTKNYRTAMKFISKTTESKIKNNSYYNQGSIERFRIYSGITYARLGLTVAAKKQFEKINPNQFHSFSKRYDALYYFALKHLILKDNKVRLEGEQKAKKMGYEKLFKMLVEKEIVN